MKKILKYFLFLLLLILSVFFDSQNFRFSFSLFLCVCFLLFKKSDTALIICALTGFFRDFLFFTLPYYSLIYLYISLGCVWCQELFFGINSKKAAYITFFAFLLYFVLCYLINAVNYTDAFLKFYDVCYAFCVSLISGATAMVVFSCFKRFKI